MKVQAYAATGVSDVAPDLVEGNQVIAQIALISTPVPRIEGGREHNWQSALPDAPQDAEA
jgi:hypothetical protein